MTCWKGSSSSGGSRTALYLTLPPCGECGGGGVRERERVRVHAYVLCIKTRLCVCEREGESAGPCIHILYQNKVVCVCERRSF